MIYNDYVPKQNRGTLHGRHKEFIEYLMGDFEATSPHALVQLVRDMKLCKDSISRFSPREKNMITETALCCVHVLSAPDECFFDYYFRFLGDEKQQGDDSSGMDINLWITNVTQVWYNQGEIATNERYLQKRSSGADRRCTQHKAISVLQSHSGTESLQALRFDNFQVKMKTFCHLLWLVLLGTATRTRKEESLVTCKKRDVKPHIMASVAIFSYAKYSAMPSIQGQ